MRMRDELGILYQDEACTALFPPDGQPALAPWKLALITNMQFAEQLPDHQAADAVRARLDWKYALGLELEDQGFDFSVLSEFRSRLIAGHAEYLLLATMLDHFKQRGLVKAGGRQRTDATHVLAKVRALNRVLCIGETFRATLNSLALVAPAWLHSFASEEWHARYGHRIEEKRLPQETTKRSAAAEIIGADGYQLLSAIDTTPALNWLHHVPAVQILRQGWLQQFEMVDGQVHSCVRLVLFLSTPEKIPAEWECSLE